MDKLEFIIPRPPRTKESGTPPMRVTAAAYNAVEEISARTGLSNSYVASKMIEFAAQHTEVTFEPHEDIK